MDKGKWPPNFSSQAALIFVAELKEDSERVDAPASMVRDWRIIAAWIGYTQGDLSLSQKQKISCAWEAYLSIGLAPSAPLQPAFDEFAACRSSNSHERPPTEVLSVFDRLLVTDTEIAEKRATDWQREQAHLGSLFQRLKRTQPSWWRRQSRTRRLWVFACVSWATVTLIYALVFDPFEAGGWDYYDAHERLRVYVIGLAPIGAAVLTYIYHRWIK